MLVARAVLVCAAALSTLGMHCHRREPARVAAVTPGASATIVAAVCGDGVLARDEQCDDANLAIGDGCHACRVEAPRCAADREGVVQRWTCEGMPSRCAVVECSGDACPAELATRTLTTSVRLEGFVTPSSPSVRVSGAVDCGCTETLGGRVCEPGCVAKVAACSRIALAAPGASWGWSCQGASCALQVNADATVEARVAAGPITVAHAVSMPDAWDLRLVAKTRETVLLVGTAVSGATIGGVTVGANGTGMQRVFAAIATPAGGVRRVVALGDSEALAVHAAAFTEHGFWLVTSAGDQRRYDDSLANDPTFAAWRFDAAGRRVATVPLGRIEVSSLRAAALSEDGLAIAYGQQRIARDGDRGKPANVHAAFVVAALAADGHVRWQQREPRGSVRPLAMRVVAGRMHLAGMYSGEPLGLAQASNPQLFAIAIEQSGRRVATHVEPSSHPGLAFAGNGDLVVLRPQHDPAAPHVLERLTPTGKRVWSRPLARSHVGTHAPDVMSFVGDERGERFAWLTRELDDTNDYQRGHRVVRVVDSDGRWLHAWSMPVRPPAQLEAALVGLDDEGGAILAGSIRGPLELGRLRVEASSSLQAALWLAPRSSSAGRTAP